MTSCKFVWSRSKNCGFFPISAVRARPSAMIRVVEVKKLRTFYGFCQDEPSAGIGVVDVQKLRDFFD